MIVLFYQKKAHMIIYQITLYIFWSKIILIMQMIWADPKTVGHAKNIFFKIWAIPYYSEKDHRYCPMCNKSIPIEWYRNHIGGCFNFDRKPTFVLKKLAEPGEFMEFYNFNNQLHRRFVVYADFECSFDKIRWTRHTTETRANLGGLYFCKYI